MTKIERNEMIIKFTKENKTNAEIIKAIKALDDKMPISDDTIRKVRKDAGIEYSNGFVGKSTFSTEELYKMIQSLQDEIIELKDDLAIDHAKIQSLEADVIKASTVHSNELKSDKKYIVTRFSTREFISYANEDELSKYITVYGNRIPIATIDNGIKEKSNWICRPDDIMITFTVQNVIDDVDLQTKILSNKHSELQNTIRDIQELMK